MIITFLGQRDFVSTEKAEKYLVCLLEQSIKEGAVEFFLGGYGNFDHFVAGILRKLKLKYEYISIVFVTPYINKDFDINLYDCSIYPPIEHIPLKIAILERNKWMIQNADVIISTVERSYGGASKALAYAQKLGKKIINLYDDNGLK